MVPGLQLVAKVPDHGVDYRDTGQVLPYAKVVGEADRRRCSTIVRRMPEDKKEGVLMKCYCPSVGLPRQCSVANQNATRRA